MLTALLRVLKYNRNHEPAGSPKGGQFARGKGGGVIPQTPLGHKRLYHGGQNVDTLSLDKASVMSLFTKGIYLTDSPRVAGDYAENANTGKFSFGKFKTRAEVIERHIRTLARLTSDEGKVGDSFGYNNNDATFPARLKQAAAWWKEHSKEFSVRQATDKTWTIQRKEKKTSAKHIYDVPEDVLARTLDAESEVPSKVLSELTYTLRSLGDGATARDIDTFVDQYVRGPEASGYRPSFREIYTGITADSPLISEDGQKAFRQALKKLGYTGIQYSGGITLG
jgi:hypothetical protein